MNKGRKLRYMVFFLFIALTVLVVVGSLSLNNRITFINKAAEFIPQAIGKQPVLLLTLLINRPEGTIELTSMKQGFSYLPNYNIPALDSIQVEMKEASGKTQKYLIPIPTAEMYSPPIDTSQPDTEPRRKSDIFTYTVILPYKDNASIQIQKDFPDSRQPKTASLQVKIPSRGTSSSRVQMNGAERSITIESLSRDTLPTAAQSGSIETIFDGDPTQTDPSKTLDIVFVSSGFTESEYQLFKDFTLKQADGLFGFNAYPGKAPFNSKKPLIKIRRFVSSDIYHFRQPGGSWSVDYDRVQQTLVALGIPYDQISIVLDEDGRSWSSYGGLDNVLFSRGSQSILLFAHEFGHSFSALDDEYIYYSGIGGVNSVQRNCKKDVKIPWNGNVSDGAFIGCGSSNLYRPAKSSIMKSLDINEEFNATSKYLIEEAFKAFTENNPNLVSLNQDKVEIYKWNDYIGNPYNSVNIRNLGRLPNVNFLARFSPSVAWASLSLSSNTTPAYVTVIGNASLLTRKGKYQTNLIVNSTTSNTKSLTIPVDILVQGDRRIYSSLRISSPRSNQIINHGDMVPFVVEKTTDEPGWKTIQYNYTNPGGNELDVRIFAASTVTPFTASWNTLIDPEGEPFRPGTYTFWVSGYPYFELSLVNSNKVTVDLKAQPGTLCSRYSYDRSSYACSTAKNSTSCFRGAQDCEGGGLPYCCPNTGVTPFIPTTTPIRIPTQLPTNAPIPQCLRSGYSCSGVSIPCCAGTSCERYSGKCTPNNAYTPSPTPTLRILNSPTPSKN